MNQDEFTNMFDPDDLNDIAAMAATVDKEVAKAMPTKPKKGGVWYVRDEQSTDGHTVSVYALNMAGKTLAWITVDNDIVETDETLLAPLGEIPPYVTVHRLFIWNAYRTDGYLTSNGFALRYPQKHGVHVDTNTVRSYVMPRLALILARLYGA